MSRLLYDGKRIRPTPFYSISEEIQEQPGGRLGTLFNITIVGKIVVDMGSPNSSGIFATGTNDFANESIPDDAHLASMMRKYEAIRQLFSTDGKKLEIYSDGTENAYVSTPLVCYPRVKRFSEPDELLYNIGNYSIELETDHIYGYGSLDENLFANYVSSANESWSVQEEDGSPHVFRLNHQCSAVGKRAYISGVLIAPAYVQAQNYVRALMGYDVDKVMSSSAISGIVSSVFNTASLSGYNYVSTEEKDELTGSYSLSETWLLSSGNVIDTYQVKVDYLAGDATRTRNVSVDGNVRGLYEKQNDYESGYNVAVAYFNNVVQSGIQSRIDGYTTNTHFNSVSVNYDKFRANVGYSYNFDDKPLFSGVTEEYQVTSRYTAEDYKTTVLVEGKINGLLRPGETDYTLKYPRAFSWWDKNARGQLYSRAQNYSSGVHGSEFVQNLQSVPITKDVTENPIEGSIQYSFSYNNRAVSLSNETFSVSRRFSRADGNTVVVAGTIQGIDNTGSGTLLTRYNNALLAFPTDSVMYNRVTTYATGVYVNSTPFAREVTQAPNDGAISYSYEYNGLINPIFPNALSELIQVVDINPGVIAPSVPVMGRQAGPILQAPLVNTFTERRKQIAIELMFLPYSGVANYSNMYAQKPNTSSILTALKPTGIQTYLVDDQENFDIFNNRYSRNATYQYEV